MVARAATNRGGGRRRDMRKKALEEALDLPNDGTPLTAEQLIQFYRLDAQRCSLHEPPNPKSVNCKDNPYCLNRIGEEKLLRLLKETESDKTHKLEDSKCRDTQKQPCGLVNASNFCYANSFVQIMFADVSFRQIVFDWRPSPAYIPPPEPGMNIQAVMNTLQELFFVLQTSPYEDAEAHKFYSSLRLGTEQQDAQEFCVKFFEALERNLPSHPNGGPISKRIQERLDGRTKETLKCKCGHESSKETKFTSIALSPQGHDTLSSAIAAFLAPEKMSDYKCGLCCKAGGCEKSTSIELLPPVLFIQLNRYIFDVNSGRTKLKTALQYPRELSSTKLAPRLSPSFKYDLAAVMVHEGGSAEFGHYFDIIRHSDSGGTWFKFDDAKVKETKPPGVHTETKTTKDSKASQDLKFCYCLVYRRNEKFHQPTLPPSEITSKWQNTLSRRFERQTLNDLESTELCLSKIKERFHNVMETIKELEVKSDKTVQKKPKDVALVSSELLCDILQKEHDWSKRMQESVTAIANDSGCVSDTSLLEGENEESPGTSSPSKAGEEKQTSNGNGKGLTPTRSSSRKSVYASRVRSFFARTVSNEEEKISSTLSSHEFELCPHGKVPLEKMLKGELKAVVRSAAEYLIGRYGLQITTADGSRERLRSAADLCEGCVRNLIREAHFRKKLEEMAKTAAAIQKDVKKRCSVELSKRGDCPPADFFFVAKNALMTFKKDAAVEWERREAATTPLLPPAIRILHANSLEQPVPRKRVRRRLVTEETENGDEKVKPGNRTENGKTNEEEGGKEKMEEGGEEDVIVHESTSHDGTPDPSTENGMETAEREKSGSGEQEGSEDEEESNLDSDPVVFNSQLKCKHGGINVSEFRHAVSPEEWQLLSGYFEHSFPVPCDADICQSCNNDEKEAIDGKENTRKRIKELQTIVGPAVRACDSRREVNGSGKNLNNGSSATQPFVFGVCSKFINDFKLAAKSNASSNSSGILPPICQECLFCKHGLPFIGRTPLASGSGVCVLPMTEEEWVALSTGWVHIVTEAQAPREIVLADGEPAVLCVECNAAAIAEVNEHRFIYERQSIFIKMQEDEPDKSSSSASSSAPPTNGAAAQNGTAVPVTTRVSTRRAQKGLIQLKMSSSHTVKNLKLELYAKLHHSPCDQLLYYNGDLLEDRITLGKAGILPNNNNNPIILLVQTHAKDTGGTVATEAAARVPERGFADTALNH